MLKVEHSKWRHLSYNHQHHSPSNLAKGPKCYLYHTLFFLGTVMKINFNSDIILKRKYTI